MEPSVKLNKISEEELSSEEFIIAIGASAGGIEAIHELFDNTPSDAVSYVIIQHLSPDYKSLTAQLLVKHSRLKIYVAENGMEISSNCVYVMPEGKTMTISGGKLFLKDREGSAPNSAIDTFFNSLAIDKGSRSIAIVLAGNGSDGIKGIEAIKKMGGMVIVQDPSSTDNKSMPNSAIETGFYDFVLSPKQIPGEIVNYIKQKTLTDALLNPETENNELALKEILDLVKNYTPLDFSEYKHPTIIRRIIRRMTIKNSNTIGHYIQLLKSDPDEIVALAKDFLISVTKFFRDREAFEIIGKKVIPELIENKLLTDTLKVWVIGCATGEEAYSLAILIKEHLINIKKDLDVKIFATDIDKEALAKASKGCYPESIEKDVSDARLNTFFSKEGIGYKVRDNIRRMVVFADHDITSQPPYGKIDLITCRNLLIYFNPTLQKKIFSTIHYCLNKGGYLFLGPSEGLGSIKDLFEETDKKWKIYKNLDSNYKSTFNSYSPQFLEIKKPIFPSITLRRSSQSVPNNLLNLINESLLEEAGFLAGVCVDENFTVIFSFGRYEKYLVPKLFSNNLLELLPPEMSIVAATSTKEAIIKKAKVQVKSVSLIQNQTKRFIKILVKPVFNDSDSLQKIILLLFAEEEIKKDNDEIVEVFKKDLYEEKYISYLEQELAEIREKLQESDQLLNDSFNNMQSYNEELVSSSEEMQSANEELQSINEELTTLNNEYQLKIKEISDLNDDLDNYFRSTHISQLYVDQNLLIRKFNPVAMQQINIRENDIGRPLAEISTNIRFSSLIEDIAGVIATQTTQEKEIEITNGKWFSMLIVPYIRSQDKTSNGAIIAFHDITDIKKSKKVIEENNARLTNIIKDHDTFIYSVSHDLKSPLNNMEGLLNLIQGSKNIDQIKSFTVHLNKSVINLKGTIDELTHLATIEDGPINEEKVNIEQLFEEVKLSINNSIIDSNATIVTDFEEKIIKFSKKNLRSILLNFLSNSIKYRAKERQLQIHVRVRRVKEGITLTFQDNGLGIAENKLTSLFIKYKRLHDKELNVEGSGIGLFLVKKIITNGGGRIEVESKGGSGTTFIVYFKG